ncbi:MAG: leucyl aminopeptidase [Helicobacteraceae bacterium]|jgi:leucyl aminopeptidase|nr:leucyl aminopeptidase [Helicobacteraceae bacterium]
MKIEFNSGAKADIRVIFTLNKDLGGAFVSDRALLEKVGFDGADESTALFAERGELYVGVEDENDPESFRIAAAKAIGVLKTLKVKSASIASYDKSGADRAKAIAFGLALGAYEFNEYKSKPKERSLEAIYFNAENYYGAKTDENAVKAAIGYALVVAEGVNFARDLVNRTPEDMTPSALANEAQKAAGEHQLKCEIKDESYLQQNGMGAMLAVGRASVNPPRLIHLIYKPEKAKKTVAIVGKGLTYDSGGLSLKPADYMSTMKADMSGGAAAIAIIKTAARLGLNIEIHAVIGAAENMIGGKAYKPDDVLRAKNGKTIEVKNTDAEGRLVLADCLCYAQENAPELDYIIDLATLTGACVVALGEYTSGVMGFNDDLKRSLLQSAKNGGELAAELPFNRHLKKLLKSEIADLSNCAPVRYGGAITAALFLSEFIEEKNRDKWAHLDIAGPSFVEKAWGVNPFGASGAAVRWAIDWLERL